VTAPHTSSRREPLPGALDVSGESGQLDTSESQRRGIRPGIALESRAVLAALTDAVVLLLERHETTAYNEWSGNDLKRLQASLSALGGKHRINRLGDGTHAPGRDPLCAVCVETAGKERLLAAVDPLVASCDECEDWGYVQGAEQYPVLGYDAAGEPVLTREYEPCPVCQEAALDEPEALS
jgi:hypothetical protein